MTTIKIKKGLTKKSIGVTLVVAIIAVIGFGGLYLLDSKTSAQADSRSNVKSNVFEFTGAEGWWQGATSYDSMALFDSNEKRACFVSAEFKQGQVDTRAEYIRREAEIKKIDSGYVISHTSSSTEQLSTLSGSKQYELKSYSITEGSQPTKRGLALGYVQFADGYVQVQSWCDEPTQLPTAFLAINAIKVNK